jgi:ABC-type microcin C transport system duplicated ATPase subunit YejF
MAAPRNIAHRVGVVQDGRLVELALTAQMLDAPQQDHTRLPAAVAGRRRGREVA